MSNPVNHTDAVFLKQFVLLIVFLTVLSVLLVVLAAFIYGRNPPEANPARAVQTVQRIAPVGGVYAGDTGAAAILAAQEAAKGSGALEVAFGGSTDGQEIYAKVCQACHDLAATGAPVLTDKANWAPRVAQGVDTLVQHAIDGYTGSAGLMPARGGKASLSDEQVKATVEWMLTQIQ